MEIGIALLPFFSILAAVSWYSLFAQIPFSRLDNRYQIFESLQMVSCSESSKYFARGSMSRLEIWRLNRQVRKQVLADLGIAHLRDALPIDTNLDSDKRVSKIRRKT